MPHRHEERVLRVPGIIPAARLQVGNVARGVALGRPVVLSGPHDVRAAALEALVEQRLPLRDPAKLAEQVLARSLVAVDRRDAEVVPRSTVEVDHDRAVAERLGDRSREEPFGICVGEPPRESRSQFRRWVREGRRAAAERACVLDGERRLQLRDEGAEFLCTARLPRCRPHPPWFASLVPQRPSGDLRANVERDPTPNVQRPWDRRSGAAGEAAQEPALARHRRGRLFALRESRDPRVPDDDPLLESLNEIERCAQVEVRTLDAHRLEESLEGDRRRRAPLPPAMID